MLTKGLWVNTIEDFEWYEEHNCRKDEVVFFIGFIALILFSPVSLLIDLTLLPFEIAYYFFCRWIEKKVINNKKRRNK